MIAGSEHLTRRLRRSASWTFVATDALSPVAQAGLSPLLSDQDICGLMVSASNPPQQKAISFDVRQALEAASEERSLFDVATATGASAEDLLNLVFAGFLEIEFDGLFISGPQADTAFNATPRPHSSRRLLAELSLQAIKHAESLLSINNPASLAARMYFFNRVPVDLADRARFADAAAVLEYLDASRHRVSGWSITANRHDGWIYFTQPSAPKPSQREQQGIYKLYASPVLQDLPECLDLLLSALTPHRCIAVKVGADAWGIHRPDKLVAYFNDKESMLAAAEDICSRIGHLRVHGTPFTSQIGDTGILSWGLDPPLAAKTTAWMPNESWRVWLANKLAVFLVEARMAALPSSHCDFALTRLSRLGVDLENWEPTPALWTNL